MDILEEEKFILSQLMDARHNVDKLKKHKQDTQFRIIEAENIQGACEQAMIDYMIASGLKNTEVGDITVTLGKSLSVDVSDVDSVPEKYIRIKEIKEVNKALIKSLNLEENNWLKYSEKQTLIIRNKHT